MKKQIISFLGWYGVVAVVVAYVLISFSLVSSNALVYQLLNLSGALGIMIETYYKKDYQPFWLNLIWAGIALIAIIKLFT